MSPSPYYVKDGNHMKHEMVKKNLQEKYCHLWNMFFIRLYKFHHPAIGTFSRAIAQVPLDSRTSMRASEGDIPTGIWEMNGRTLLILNESFYGFIIKFQTNRDRNHR